MEIYRQNICSVINVELNILEIGASHSPLIEHNKPNIYNIDVMTKKQLIEKNTSEGTIFDKSKIPETDFLLTNNNEFDFYKCIGDNIKFNYILSSHNFEHFPNLIKSLNSLYNILSDDGKIIAFIPDCRFIFDRYRNITKITKIIADFYTQKNKPSLEELIENRLYYCNNTTNELWCNYNNDINSNYLETIDKIKLEENNLLLDKIYTGNNRQSIDFLYKQYLELEYIDTHVNCFTPNTFKIIIDTLLRLGYINLKIDTLYETIEGSFEFLVILTKNT